MLAIAELGVAVRLLVVLVSLMFTSLTYAQCESKALGQDLRLARWVAPTHDTDNQLLSEKRRLRIKKYDLYLVAVDEAGAVTDVLESGKPIATAKKNETSCLLKLPKGRHWVAMTATNKDGTSELSNAVQY